METKKIVALSLAGVGIGLTAWFGVAAAGIAGEAAKLDEMMKTSIHSHEPVASVQQKVASMGFQLESPAVANTGLKGKGPDHLAVIYRTWLTLSVDSDQDGKATGYHIDRAGKMF